MTTRVRLVSVTEARRQWGALLHDVQNGQIIVLTRRRACVAVLESLVRYAVRSVAMGSHEALALTPALDAAWHRTVEVLGDETRARHWLVTPRRSLGGRTPVEAAVDGDMEQLYRLLAAIEHGIVL